MNVTNRERDLRLQVPYDEPDEAFVLRLAEVARTAPAASSPAYAARSWRVGAATAGLIGVSVGGAWASGALSGASDAPPEPQPIESPGPSVEQTDNGDDASTGSPDGGNDSAGPGDRKPNRRSDRRIQGNRSNGADGSDSLTAPSRPNSPGRSGEANPPRGPGNANPPGRPANPGKLSSRGKSESRGQRGKPSEPDTSNGKSDKKDKKDKNRGANADRGLKNPTGSTRGKPGLVESDDIGRQADAASIDSRRE